MVVSRLDRLVMDVSLRLGREVSPTVVPRPRTISARYFPDLLAADGRPLVHDLVTRSMWLATEQRPTGMSRAWSGEATVTLGDSEQEDLGGLRPLEVLEGYFVHIDTFSGATQTAVLHDYRADR